MERRASSPVHPCFRVTQIWDAKISAPAFAWQISSGGHKSSFKRGAGFFFSQPKYFFRRESKPRVQPAERATADSEKPNRYIARSKEHI